MRLADFKDRFPSLCDRLLQAKRKDRVGQAYLFVGDDPGLLGRFTDAWAQVCACRQPQADGEPCGDCSVCTRMARDAYPERYVLRPESKSRQILISDVRDFEHQLSLSADRREMKIGIIAEADCLGEEAQNAFLKTLEEPCPGAMLLLYTTQPRRLLPTIRSRCQVVSLLQNRRTYVVPIKHGLFAQLARLRRNAGAAVGLSVSTRIADVLAALRAQAEENVGDEHDERWDGVADGDRALQKRLAEQQAARVEAEYLRLREDVIDAVQTWFLQQSLRAAGISDQDLPQPELLGDVPDDLLQPPGTNEAEEALRLTAEFVHCLHTNTPEDLSVEVFCLSLCRLRRE